nr:hypothetical protein [Tanacetum cinerariifolium]
MIRSLIAEPKMDEMKLSFAYGVCKMAHHVKKLMDDKGISHLRNLQNNGSESTGYTLLKTQFQLFINFRYYFDDFDGTMICKSIDERELHKREYDIRRNARLMQSKVGNVDSSKALNVGLIVRESSETKSKRHVSSSISENDTHTDDADINSLKNKQPMVKVKLSAEHNILANEQQHSVQSESIYVTYLLEKGNNVLESRNIDLESSMARLLAENVKLNKENEHLKQTYKDLSDSIKKTSVQSKDHADSLIIQLNCKSVKNADLKAQIQEKVFANAALKNELRKIKGISVDTKLAKLSTLGKPVLQPHRNQSVVRKPHAFKSEQFRFSKPRFATQVDVKYDFPKSVTPYYLPIVRDLVLEKPHHKIAPSLIKNSSKESHGSSDMTHKYYLEEAKKRHKKEIGSQQLV